MRGTTSRFGAAHLLMKHIPYVNRAKHVKYGTLVSTLHLSGEATTTPDTHVAYFSGEHPCDSAGVEIADIKHGSNETPLRS